MAETRQRYQRQKNNSSTTSRTYVDGNTVKKLQTAPLPREDRVPEVSRNARRNRKRALSMSPGFVMFLAVVSVAILFCCVSYIQTKSEITSKAATLASLETEYNQLKADNDAYYSQVSTSVNIDTVRNIAITKLGMRYATDDQIVEYRIEKKSYVRQYQKVPAAK